MSKLILIIGINYSPEITGIGKYTSEFAKYLADTKACNVTVITGVPYYPQWQIYEGYKNTFHIEDIGNVKVYRCPLYIPKKPRTMKRLAQDILFFASAFIHINRLLIQRKKMEIIFIPVPSFSNGLLGLYYRFFFRKAKVVYHIQDLQIDAADKLGMIRNNFLIRMLFGIERFILKRVDIVSTISTGMREKIMSKTSELRECLIFPNWIDSDNIFPISKEDRSINTYSSLFQDKKIIFYSGAMGEKQGLEMVIDAAVVFQNNNEFVFVISGEGPYRNKLQSYADAKGVTNVRFLDLLPLVDFNKMLNNSFIHLVIQRESGRDLFLPSKLTNILGVGGCVIVTASQNTSLYDIIETNKCGYIIPPSSLPDLCASIQELYDNNILRDELKQNAINYARKNLYKSNIIDAFLEKINSTTPYEIEPVLSV